ncbi:MAG: hypothetical protein EOP48_07710 [Sphingobacteriales bacterium]|nr:MAG: hypothetical protein EOP48_07710 [Sphingobacteriales bacterium]
MSDNESQSSQDENIERQPKTSAKKLHSQSHGHTAKHVQKQNGHSKNARGAEIVGPMEGVDKHSDQNAWPTGSSVGKRKRNISDERRQQLRNQMHSIRAMQNNKADERRQLLEQMARAKEEELGKKMEKEALKLAKQRLQERKQTPAPAPIKKKQKVITVYSSSSESSEDEESSSSEEEVIIVKKRERSKSGNVPPPPVLKRNQPHPTHMPIRPIHYF